jgi:hypothetical protein
MLPTPKGSVALAPRSHGVHACKVTRHCTSLFIGGPTLDAAWVRPHPRHQQIAGTANDDHDGDAKNDEEYQAPNKAFLPAHAPRVDADLAKTVREARPGRLRQELQPAICYYGCY